MTEFFHDAAEDAVGAIEGMATVEEHPSDLLDVVEHPEDALGTIHADGAATVGTAEADAPDVS